MILDKSAPQVHDVFGAFRQIAARGQVADQISSGSGQRRVSCLGDPVIALAKGIIADLRVDVTCGARHMLRADGFDPRGFHRVIQILGHLALGHVFCRRFSVMELVA